MAGELVALVTCPFDRAKDLAFLLVREKLVACVNVIPKISSVYFWDGKLNCDDEALLLMKTHADLCERLQQRIKSIHPYEVPEIIFLSIVDGYPPYLEWLRACVEPGRASQ